MKAFIISQPKAGTYLCTNILKNLNLNATGMHVKNSKYRKYPLDDNPIFNSKQEVREYIKKYTYYEKSFGHICNKIENNQFAVGHLPCEKKYINGLKDFKKILLLRDVSDIEKSLKRFSKEQFGGTSVSREGFDLIGQWKYQSNIFVLNFEDMINKNYKCIDNLQIYLFNDIKFKSDKVLKRALQQPSLTKSKIR